MISWKDLVVVLPKKCLTFAHRALGNHTPVQAEEIARSCEARGIHLSKLVVGSISLQFFLIWFLVTAVSGRPKLEMCPLPGRLRWRLLPKERYGNSPSGRGSNTQPSKWGADTLPLSHCRSQFHCNAATRTTKQEDCFNPTRPGTTVPVSKPKSCECCRRNPSWRWSWTRKICLKGAFRWSLLNTKYLRDLSV